MLKKQISYEDYDGNKRQEDFYFNLTKAEITEMELSIPGGLVNHINTITKAQDGTEIMKVFKDIILGSYGEKSPDGKRFIKSEELSTAFSQTEAYSILFMSLVTDAEAAAAFINGIVPQISEEDKKTAT